MVSAAFDAASQKKSVPVIVVRGIDDPDTILDRLEFDTIEKFTRHLQTQYAPEGGYYDLSGQDLSGLDISFARLNHADLRDTNLKGTQLELASLHNARLSGADCTNANFKQAEMVRVRFSPEKGEKRLPAVLDGADFTYAHMAAAKMAKVSADSAVFQTTVLADADLEDSDLTNADLSYATAEGTNFKNAVLDNATLYMSGLNSADMTDAQMSNANIDGADMSLTVIKWQTLQQCIGQPRNDPRTNARLLAPHRRKGKAPNPAGA